MKSFYFKYIFIIKYIKNVKWWLNCCYLFVKYMLNYLEVIVYNIYVNSNNILMVSILYV